MAKIAFLNAHLVALQSPQSNDKMVAFQEGAYLMDQEFDGKGLTPYDPAHNSTYILAGKTLTTISGKKYWGLDVGKEREINKFVPFRDLFGPLLS